MSVILMKYNALKNCQREFTMPVIIILSIIDPYITCADLIVLCETDLC